MLVDHIEIDMLNGFAPFWLCESVQKTPFEAGMIRSLSDPLVAL